MQILFGLQPFYYHVVVISSHLLVIVIFNKLLLELKLSRLVRLIALIIYALHSIHTVSLSWLAAYSFVLGPGLLLLSLTAYIKGKYVTSWLYYFLSLLATEVSLVFLLWMLGFHLVFRINPKWRVVMSFGFVSFLLIWFRFYLFPTQQSTDLYKISVSLESIFVVKFYFYRLLGIPMLINQMPILIKMVTYLLGGVFFSLLILGSIIVFRKKTLLPYFLNFWILIALSGLVPFIVLPNHAAPHYLSYTLIGFSVLTGYLIVNAANFFPKFKKLIIGIAVGLFVTLQVIGIEWTYQTHWIFKRAEMAQRLIREKKLEHTVGSEEYFSLGANAAKSMFK